MIWEIIFVHVCIHVFTNINKEYKQNNNKELFKCLFFNLFISLPRLSSLCFMMMILHSSPVPSNYHCAVLLQPLLHTSIWRRSSLRVSKQRLGTQLGYVLLLVKQEAGVCFKLLFTDSLQAMRVEWGRGEEGGWSRSIYNAMSKDLNLERAAIFRIHSIIGLSSINFRWPSIIADTPLLPNVVEKRKEKKKKNRDLQRWGSKEVSFQRQCVGIHIYCSTMCRSFQKLAGCCCFFITPRMITHIANEGGCHGNTTSM